MRMSTNNISESVQKVFRIEYSDEIDLEKLENKKPNLQISEPVSDNDDEDTTVVYVYLDTEVDANSESIRDSTASISTDQTNYFTELMNDWTSSEEILQTSSIVSTEKSQREAPSVSISMNVINNSKGCKSKNDDETITKKDNVATTSDHKSSIKKKYVLFLGYNCSLCTTFNTKSVEKAINHLISDHGKLKKNIECYSTFSKLERLKFFKRSFKCILCSQTFRQQGNIYLHSRLHTGEKPYLCIICNTNFRNMSNLKSHQKIHVNYWPYKCDYCGAMYRHYYLYNRCIRKHNREFQTNSNDNGDIKNKHNNLNDNDKNNDDNNSNKKACNNNI